MAVIWRKMKDIKKNDKDIRQMTRIVHATSVHNPFDSRILYRECIWLAKSGYEVFLTAPAEFSERQVKNVKILGVKKHTKLWFKKLCGSVKPNLSHVSRLKRPLIWLEILKKIYRLDPDIVHIHDPELLIIAPFIKVLQLLRNFRLLSIFKPIGVQGHKKVKIIYDVHEYFVESIVDKFWIPLKFRKMAALFASWIEFFLGIWVDGQVFVVSGQIPYYLRWKTLKAIVHNYPDLDKFPMNCRYRTNKYEKFTLVHIGSLYERRGIMTMLEALKLLNEGGYDVNLILGGIFESKEFRFRVEDFIEANNLESNVEISDWIDYPVLNQYLARAHAAWLAIYPSRQYSRQSISTKQLEAMAAGLPVICSDIPSLTRFTEEAACGISVPAKDAAAHADAVKRLYDNPEQAKKMGINGHNLVAEKFNWHTEASDLINFYSNLL